LRCPSGAREILVSTDTLKSFRAGDGLMIDDAGRLMRLDPSGLPTVELVTDQDGMFPDTDSVIPARTNNADGLDGTWFGFGAEYLSDLLAVVVGMQASAKMDAPAVVFSWIAPAKKDSANPLRMDARTAGMEFIGVIMPVSLQ